ncbi:MAG: hypothetical protein NC489_11560 [Ruminococcus flavefaciens]|nr:hypothetical protein [Ruminococcus flavefaciens]
MTSGIITLTPLIPIVFLLHRVIVRGEKIQKIKERSDQIVGMICGNDIQSITDMTTE